MSKPGVGKSNWSRPPGFGVRMPRTRGRTDGIHQQPVRHNALARSSSVNDRSSGISLLEPSQLAAYLRVARDGTERRHTRGGDERSRQRLVALVAATSLPLTAVANCGPARKFRTSTTYAVGNPLASVVLNAGITSTRTSRRPLTEIAREVTEIDDAVGFSRIAGSGAGNVCGAGSQDHECC